MVAAEYNHHHRILIAVLLLLVSSCYTTTPVLGGSITTITITITTTTQKEDGEKQATTTTTTSITTTQKEEGVLEEKQDQRVRRSIARAALNLENPFVFPFLVRKYYENTYYIHPQTKVLVSRVPVNPRFKAFHRCRRCPRPAPITEADWKRYEAAVNRPSDLWITPLDVAKFRLWLGANPSSPL